MILEYMKMLAEKVRQCFDVAEMPLMILGVLLAIAWMVSMSPGLPGIEDLTEMKVNSVSYFHARTSADFLEVVDDGGNRYRLMVGGMDEDRLKKLAGNGGEWKVWYRLDRNSFYENEGAIYQIEVDRVLVLSLEESNRIIEGRVSIFDMWFLLTASVLLCLYVVYLCRKKRR